MEYNTYADRLKEQLNNLISEMAKHPSMFAVSSVAFSRTKKLSFEDTVKAVINMQGGSMNKALPTLGLTCTTPGFTQRRDQLTSEAFEFLYRQFTDMLDTYKKYKGYRLFAIDGSEIAAPANPDSPSYRASGYVTKTGRLAKGCNLIHLNAMYDLANNIYQDAVITVLPTERAAAETMIKRYGKGYDAPEKGIVICDRGYSGYNLMETFNRNPLLKYIIRIPSNPGAMKATKHLPYAELDIDCTETIVTKQKDYIKGQNILLPGPSPKGKKKKRVSWLYENNTTIKFRLVRFKIKDTGDNREDYETLVTSLPRDVFPLEEMKELYHLRWGIETSFRNLKYDVGLVNLHSKKDDAIYQSIWASLIMYNFAMAIAGKAVVKQKYERKYNYRINTSDAVYVIREFYRQVMVHAPPNGKALMKRIEKNLVPIRPGRHDERKLSNKGYVYFMYRVAA